MSLGEDHKPTFITYIVAKSWESEYCISEASFSCGFQCKQNSVLPCQKNLSNSLSDIPPKIDAKKNSLKEVSQETIYATRTSHGGTIFSQFDAMHSFEDPSHHLHFYNELRQVLRQGENL